jgi:chromosomal replication initiation ATPase DnaA
MTKKCVRCGGYLGKSNVTGNCRSCFELLFTIARIGKMSPPLGYRFVGQYVVPLPPRILIRDIQAKVADHYGLTVPALTSAARWRKLAWPRQVAMHLAKRLTPHNLSEIGRRFNRDHATVLHAVRQIEARRIGDAELDRTIRSLTAQLEAT